MVTFVQVCDLFFMNPCGSWFAFFGCVFGFLSERSAIGRIALCSRCFVMKKGGLLVVIWFLRARWVYPLERPSEPNGSRACFFLFARALSYMKNGNGQGCDTNGEA